MSGGGYGSQPTYGQPQQSLGGSTAAPWSAFGGSTSGNTNSGNFDPNNPFGSSNMPSQSSYSGGPSTGGNTGSGNFDPNNPFPGMDWSSMQQYLQQPYQPYMQPQQSQQQPQYIGNNPTAMAQIASGQLSGDQINNLNSDWLQGQQNQRNFQNGQSQTQPPAQATTSASPASANPFGAAKSGLPPGYQPGPNGTIQFTPPAYPTWLYGPTAGAFGGVTPPPGTPQGYGYFPGTQTWGAQPNGNKF